MRLPRHYRKNKRTLWRKGETSSSNPKTTKFRDAARPNQAKGGKKSTTIHPPGYVAPNSAMESVDDSQSDRVSIASIITTASNPLFGDLANTTLDQTLANNVYRQKRLALLAAVTDAIRANNGRETCNEYYAVLMNVLSSDITADQRETVVDLLSRVITKGLTVNCLQHVFPKACPILMQSLSATKSTETTAQKHLVVSIGHLLSNAPVTSWSSTGASVCSQALEQLLPFCLSRKGTLRDCAGNTVANILRCTQVKLPAASRVAATPAEEVWLRFLHKHQTHFIELATSDSVEMDMAYVCEMVAKCWDVLTPLALRTSMRDMLLPLMRLFVNHRVQSYFVILLQKLFSHHLSEAHIPVQLCEESLVCLFEARPAIAAWLLQRNIQSSTKHTTEEEQSTSAVSKRHPMLDDLDNWMEAVVAGLTHLARQAAATGKSESASKSESATWIQVLCRLVPQLMELCLEWFLVDREAIAAPLIYSHLHYLFTQEMTEAAYLIEVGWLVSQLHQLTTCVTGLDYDMHWGLLIHLGEDLLRMACAAATHHAPNTKDGLRMPRSLEEKVATMLAQMAALRSLQSSTTPTHTPLFPLHESQTVRNVNSALDSLFGSAVELMGAHWLLDKGLGVNVLHELRERGSLRHQWVLPLLARHTKNTQLYYFRQHILPSLVTLHDLLREQMRQLAQLAGVNKSSRAPLRKKKAETADRPKKQSQDDDDDDEMMEVDEEVGEEENAVADNVEETFSEEMRRAILLEKSCANVEALFRHLWASLPGFCTDPQDVAPVREEPCILAERLLQLHTQWAGMEVDEFSGHLASLYRGAMYRGIAALSTSVADHELEKDSHWQAVVQKWITALQQTPSDLNLKENVMRSLLTCLSESKRATFIQSASVSLEAGNLTMEETILLKSLVPLMDSKKQEKLLKGSILVIKKCCAAKVSNEDAEDESGNKKLERLTLQVVSSLCSHAQSVKLLSLTLRLLCESQSFTTFSSLAKTRLQCWKSVLTHPECPTPSEPVWQAFLTELLTCLSNNAKSRQLAEDLLPLCCDWISHKDPQIMVGVVARLKQLAMATVPTNTTGDSSSSSAEVTLTQRLDAGEALRILVLAPSPSVETEEEEEDESDLPQYGRTWKELVVEGAVPVARNLVRCSERRLVRVGIQLAQALFSKAAAEGNAAVHYPMEEQLAVLKSISDDNLRALRLEVKKVLTRMISLYGVDVIRKATKNPNILKMTKALVKMGKQNEKKGY